MAKIMKPHLRHPVFCYVLRKVLRQIVGAHALSQFIHKDITVIFVIVAVAADLLVDLLCRFYFFEILRKAAHKRKCTHTGFCFCRVLCVHFCFSVHLQRCDRVPYGYCTTLKVDSVPFQSADLATTQAVESGDQNRKFQPRSLDNLEQLLHLLRIKECRLKLVLPRPIHLHGNILRYHVGFHRILQGLINYRMIVDNGIRRNGFQLLRKKLLDVPSLQFFQG